MTGLVAGAITRRFEQTDDRPCSHGGRPADCRRDRRLVELRDLDGGMAMSRDYRILVRIKNNRLWTAITETWPDVKNQSDAARRLGSTPQALNALLNMRIWPYSRRRGWGRLAQRIADALRSIPDYLFTEDLYGVKATPIEFEVDRPTLESIGVCAHADSPDVLVERVERVGVIASVLRALNANEAMVLRRLYGLDGEDVERRQDIGQSLGVGSMRVGQIHARALQKLRRPRLSKKLKEVYL